jgi:uncharacterized protein YfaQ (DUF2300 family)
MTLVTPHDIAQLAATRRLDPDLALAIAEQSGREHSKPTQTPKETEHGRTSR